MEGVRSCEERPSSLTCLSLFAQLFGFFVFPPEHRTRDRVSGRVPLGRGAGRLTEASVSERGTEACEGEVPTGKADGCRGVRCHCKSSQALALQGSNKTETPAQRYRTSAELRGLRQSLFVLNQCCFGRSVFIEREHFVQVCLHQSIKLLIDFLDLATDGMQAFLAGMAVFFSFD